MASSKSKVNVLGVPWNFAQIWNLTLDNIEDRPSVARDYMYASELGGSFCDRYLKMYGVKPTNPPNVRSKRKFQAGHMWEWVIGMVLISSGMLKKQQVRVESKLPKMLRVSGRLDFICGGDIDWKYAKENVKKIQDSLLLLDIELPPFFFTAIDKFIDKYSGQRLAETVLEMKSISSFMMEKVQKTGPMSHNVLQNFHYVYGNDQGIQTGKLMYVCKDDCIMEEFEIAKDEETLKKYRDDIRLMTKYYNAGFDKKNPTALMPPKEPLVLFEEGVWRFSKNFKVEYSSYLKMLYGYETPEAYRMAWQYKISSWNRVFKRAVRGDRMTDNNLKVIKEVEPIFPQWGKYIKMAKAAGAFAKPEEEGEDE